MKYFSVLLLCVLSACSFANLNFGPMHTSFNSDKEAISIFELDTEKTKYRIDISVETALRTQTVGNLELSLDLLYPSGKKESYVYEPHKGGVRTKKRTEQIKNISSGKEESEIYYEVILPSWHVDDIEEGKYEIKVKQTAGKVKLRTLKVERVVARKSSGVNSSLNLNLK